MNDSRENPSQTQQLYKITEITGGSHTAFEEMVRSLTPKLVPVAAYYLQSGAEDAVQEVWEKVWVNREMLAECNNPAAWIAAVTRHHCIDRFRRRKRAALRQTQLPFDDYINMLSSNDNDPERCYVKKELASIISSYVLELKEIFGVPLKLFYYDGLSVRNIAELLDITESTVKWRLYTGRQMIKQIILKEGFIYGD